MTAVQYLFFVLVLTSGLCAALQDFPQLNHIRSKVPPSEQTAAVKSLLKRIIGDRASDIIVEVDPSLGPKEKDTFQISNGEDPGKIRVTGTSGVAVAMGSYYYLKKYCHVQMTWAGLQMELPLTLPPVTDVIKITTNDRFRYYQNVCTVSYSMAFWQWERWEREIDWMALQGINLPLAFTGQEAIFQRVYLQLGFTQKDLDEHFGGPAFLAWARMGNIEGWGGPLPQMWITNKLLLQHQILDRMRSLGIIPVLPGFAGHVPRAITRVFPKANVTRLPVWGHFDERYSGVYLLEFHDPLFKKIGQMFITELRNEFGTDHIYNMDTFNEMTPASSDPVYLASAGKAVYNAMIAGDPDAVWLMQGWLFLSSFWQPPQVKALVTSVPQGRMIILDLAAETSPIFQKFESYYGQPFIWCMLHNFGGVDELYGAVTSINEGPFLGRKFPNSTMIGTGITPEGINQNEVMYEFMNENAWAPEPRNIDIWVTNFAHNRYLVQNVNLTNAWKLLMKTVYDCKDNHHDNNHVFITERPQPLMRFGLWYKPEDLFTAWDGFISAAHDLAGSQLFQYDLVDITRNCLQVMSMELYQNITLAYFEKDPVAIKAAGSKFVELLSDLDHLLNSNDRFLVGKWIADAKGWATNDDERKLLEYNARNQITLWGPDGNIVDYASKQWAGVVVDYYKPRWQFFTDWLVNLTVTKKPWNATEYKQHILTEVESPWTKSTQGYPDTPRGSPILISQQLHAKYRPKTRHPFFNHLWEVLQKRREILKQFPIESQNWLSGEKRRSAFSLTAPLR